MDKDSKVVYEQNVNISKDRKTKKKSKRNFEAEKYKYEKITRLIQKQILKSRRKN